MTKRERGLSDQVINYAITLLLSAAGAVGGVFTAYVNMSEEIAVMNTKLEFIMRDVGEIKDELKQKADKP